MALRTHNLRGLLAVCVLSLLAVAACSASSDEETNAPPSTSLEDLKSPGATTANTASGAATGEPVDITEALFVRADVPPGFHPDAKLPATDFDGTGLEAPTAQAHLRFNGETSDTGDIPTITHAIYQFASVPAAEAFFDTLTKPDPCAQSTGPCEALEAETIGDESVAAEFDGPTERYGITFSFDAGQLVFRRANVVESVYLSRASIDPNELVALAKVADERLVAVLG